MLATVTTLLAGVLFGLALAAPPGPMNAIIAEESVIRGWNAGFRAGLGAATADAVFFILAAIGAIAVVARITLIKAVMVLIGGLLMIYFAYGAAQSARDTFTATKENGLDEGKGFRKAFALALTNPYQILFWLTVGVGLLEPGTVDVLAAASDALTGLVVVRTGSPALVVGLFGGIGVWITVFPAALTFAKEKTDALAPAIAAVSAAVLAAFGIYFLSDAVLTLT